MKARDLMTSWVITASRGDTIGHVADLMLEHNVSCVPIVDDRSRVVGIVTHSDLVMMRKRLYGVEHVYALLGDWISKEELEDAASKLRLRLVETVMSEPVTTVDEDTSAADVAELMMRHRVHRLPVVKDGALVGIVSRHDLLKLLATPGTQA